MLCVFSGGDSGAGRCGWRAVVVSLEVLFLVLEAAVTQDGYHHYNADGQEYSHDHFR